MPIKPQISIFQLIVLFAVILFCNHSILADQNQIQQPELQSASELDYPPFAIVRADGNADGFSVDLLKAVVDVAGLEVDISVGPWNEIKQQLVEGRLDVLPLVAYSLERDKVLDFTAPYLQMHGTIFIRKGETSIRSEADLKDKEVLVMRDDSSHEYAVNSKIPAKLILATSFEEAMKLLSSGRHDAVLCQYLMGLQLIKKLGIKNIVSISTIEYEENLKPRTTRLSKYEQKFSFAVPEGRKMLLAQLNEGLAIVVANGKYDQLYKKWFGPILSKPAVPLITVLKSVLIILIPILFVLAVIGVWYLRREVFRKTKNLKVEIAERKQVEQTLRESEEQLSDIYNSVGNVLYYVVVGPEDCYRFQSINQAFLDITGLTESQIVGKNIEDVIPKPSILMVKDKYKKAIEEKTSVRWEETSDYPTGTKIGEVSISPIFNDNGICTHLVGSINDITDRKQAESKILRLAQIVESSLDAIVGVDLKGNVITWNPSAEKLFGYSAQEIIGTSIDKVAPDRFKGELKENIHKMLTEGAIINVETVRIRKDGTEFDALLSTAPIIENDNAIGVSVILREITDRKQMEETLISAKIEAEAANHAKSEFLANMSHELRTPLNSIIGFSQVLEIQKQGLLNDKQLEYLNNIIESSAHLLAMVNDILDLAKIETGKYELKIKLFDIAELLRRAPLTIQSLSNKKSIRVELAIPTDLGLLNGDETRIKQVIFNLLSNAVKFTEPGKRIRIDAAVEGDNIKIEVWDEGIGILEENLDKIFNPFEQGFGGKASSEKGTGLGLAISKKLVELHEGTITVTSKLGQGSRFTIILPGRIESGEQITKESLIQPSQITSVLANNAKILVTEDNKINRELIKAALDDYQLDFAESGEEAVSMTSNKEYDLILMDIQLPEMDGTEAKIQIREKSDKQIPIIALTAFAMKGDDSKYLEAGFDDYISKPINIELLIKKIQNILLNTHHGKS
jgi:PAS domain S-box-containing protein